MARWWTPPCDMAVVYKASFPGHQMFAARQTSTLLALALSSSSPTTWLRAVWLSSVMRHASRRRESILDATTQGWYIHPWIYTSIYSIVSCGCLVYDIAKRNFLTVTRMCAAHNVWCVLCGRCSGGMRAVCDSIIAWMNNFIRSRSWYTAQTDGRLALVVGCKFMRHFHTTTLYSVNTSRAAAIQMNC